MIANPVSSGFAGVLGLALACAVAAGCAKRGDAQRPGAAPVTPADHRRAALAKTDLSTPERAVRAYAEAMRDGDVAKLRAIYHLGGPRVGPYFDLMAQWVTSSVQLERAATRRFGREGAERILNALFMPPPGPTGRMMLENLDRGEFDVEVEGDRAAVGIDPIGGMELQKVGSDWKYALPEADVELDQAVRQPDGWQGGLLQILVPTQRAVAEGIESGKYPTADAAAEAAQRMLLEQGQRQGLIQPDDVGDSSRGR